MSGSSDAKTLIQTADSASNAFSSVNFEDVKEAAKVGGEVGLVLAGVGVVAWAGVKIYNSADFIGERLNLYWTGAKVGAAVGAIPETKKVFKKGTSEDKNMSEKKKSTLGDHFENIGICAVSGALMVPLAEDVLSKALKNIPFLSK